MGVHQYKIELLPRAYFQQRTPPTLSNADLERGQDFNSGWWASHPPSSRLISGLRTLLPTNKSWGETEEFITAGDWSSDMRIWRHEGRVWSITFRFSPAADGWPLMQKFLSIVRGEQCLLLDLGSGEIFEPDEEVVQDRLAKSRAMHFVRDPKGAIIQAAEEIRDESA